MPCGMKLSSNKNAKLDLVLTPENLDYPGMPFSFCTCMYQLTNISYHSHMIYLNEKLTKLTAISLRVLAGLQSNSQMQAHLECCCFVTIGIVKFL